MFRNTQNETLLDDNYGEGFESAKLQIQPDSNLNSRSPSSLGDDTESVARLSPTQIADLKSNGAHEDNTINPAVSSGRNSVSPITSIPKRITEKLKRSWSTPRTDMACQIPVLGEDEAKDFFTYRDGIVENAVKECIDNVIVPEKDGEVVGNWLLTEISLWDNEKERLVILTTHVIATVKYDFIALKLLDYRKTPLTQIDTLVIGDLVYPPKSLVPRLNGIATGVATVVKGCVLRPLQERWLRKATNNNNTQFYTSPFEYLNFEPRPRNVRGIRAMWNNGEPLGFRKKWNPFNYEIPLMTYTSHPLLWHKEPDVDGNSLYDVEDFAQNFVIAVERAQYSEGSNASCKVERKEIILENYVGVVSLFHNKNDLGFFKVRGKFSF